MDQSYEATLRKFMPSSGRPGRPPGSKNKNCDEKTPQSKEYACKLCGFASARKWNLQTHMHTHFPQRPKQWCDFCPLGFFRRSDLTRHRMTHILGRKPYACARCGKEFARQDRWRIHANRSTCGPRLLNIELTGPTPHAAEGTLHSDSEGANSIGPASASPAMYSPPFSPFVTFQGAPGPIWYPPPLAPPCWVQVYAPVRAPVQVQVPVQAPTPRSYQACAGLSALAQAAEMAAPQEAVDPEEEAETRKFHAQAGGELGGGQRRSRSLTEGEESW